MNFHSSIHARGNGVRLGGTVELGNGSVPTLTVSADDRGRPFAVQFEQVAEILAGFPRLYIEPDGAFVWTSQALGAPWQLDGVLYDRAGRLLFVELKGQCPHAEFDQLLRSLGWPATQVMIQLVREAVYLDEDEFRRYVGFLPEQDT